MSTIKKPECPVCHSGDFAGNHYLPGDSQLLDLNPVHALFHPPRFHWDCFLRWPQAKQYGKASFEKEVEQHQRSSFRGILYADANIAVFVSIFEPLHLQVLNSFSGRGMTMEACDWERKHLGYQCFPTDLHEMEHQFVHTALSKVWSLFPDRKTILESVDWSGTERHLYAD